MGITFQDADLSTAPNGTVVETADNIGTGSRQVIHVANTVKVDPSGVTSPISAASLPLPTGAATDASLATINATLGTPMKSSGGTVALVTGTAIVGKFGIDQTTPGATNLVATSARNLLKAPGTFGYVVTPFATLNLGNSSTGLAAVTNGSVATSSATFTQTDIGNARRAMVMFQSGDAGFTATAGGCFTGWFLNSTDGTNFEDTIATASSATPALARPPNFIIPLPVANTGLSKRIFGIGPIEMPYGSFKVLVQNNTGVTTGATTTTHASITFGPVADTN